MQNTFCLAAVALMVSVIPNASLHAGIGGIVTSSAEQLEGACSPAADNTEGVTCQGAVASTLTKGLTQPEFGRLLEISRSLQQIDLAELRIYQFADDVCDDIGCRGLPPDRVRPLIASEISYRSDADKTAYTRVATVTGSASTIISLFSLTISLLTFRRGKLTAVSSTREAPLSLPAGG